MKRALVLGGGGVIGVAWEAGVANGLFEAGVDPRAVDVIVGTSAGAMVGAQLAAGRLPTLATAGAAPVAGNAAAPVAGSPSAPVASNAGAPVDAKAGAQPPTNRGQINMEALRQIFLLWGAMTVTTREEAAAIGKLAREINRGAEPFWVANVARTVAVDAWPALKLLIAAVDTESGERRIFDRDSGALLERAIAASAAVPGLMPSVTIEDRLYMDGQVQSSTNADVLVAWKPAEVWIAMPTNTFTARGIGRHADRMLQGELALLKDAGCKVSLKTPSEDDAKRLGPNLMDPTRAAEAYAVGLESGKAWAAELP
jgi:NTE family protein